MYYIVFCSMFGYAAQFYQTQYDNPFWKALLETVGVMVQPLGRMWKVFKQHNMYIVNSINVPQQGKQTVF